MTALPATKKLLRIEGAEPPKVVKRADVISTDGFTIVVDGIFKSEFNSSAAAEPVARGLLEKYPMLRVEIYDATTKARTLLAKA